MINQLHKISAFAPATSANLAIGFDILGFAIEALGDTVTLEKTNKPGLTLLFEGQNPGIPIDSSKNTASVALQTMLDSLGIAQGFTIKIKKQIPVSSGLGGSAASAIAAITAFNGFLQHPLPKEALIPFALASEAVACGSAHGDNIIPCLYGGLTLIQQLEPVKVINLPIPDLRVVLIKPDWQVNTRDARALLPQYINLQDFTRQTSRLASFISALYTQDYQCLGEVCKDEIIEPRRAHLIPYFYEIKDIALKNQALCCSISGSGPTIFALCTSEKQANTIANAMQKHYQFRELDSEVFISPISAQGAYIVDQQ